VLKVQINTEKTTENGNKALHFCVVNSSNLRENENRALSIVGSSRNNGERESADFYPTPPYVVEELLKRENFSGNIWECACGDGAISKVLIEKGYQVRSTDLYDRGYGVSGIDFLHNNLDDCDNIITNPPFKLTLEFILQAKKQCKNKIALFEKTVLLDSARRYDMFMDQEFPLKCIYQFCKRVQLCKSGVKMKNGGMISYAWFVWDSAYKGEPMIRWIK
jgi:hypothetical protein